MARNKVELTMQHWPCKNISKSHTAPAIGWLLRRKMKKQKGRNTKTRILKNWHLIIRVSLAKLLNCMMLQHKKYPLYHNSSLSMRLNYFK